MSMYYVCRSWCPDRTVPQARKYISDSMGPRYAEAVLLNLEDTWAESITRTPLICFLSMGSDPTNQIEGLGKKKQLGWYMWQGYNKLALFGERGA
ncbi:hypothetical protein DPMN_161249 [Dreissena polymorpha]|uniref:Uncharacterized protein n=1 Tax=Dreissena polymorpha TaxID=45954 RepID=A0A9D4EQ32_DREPO|nr:hypothetical protein DPMN_161249 [Dreissena polymorpha]